MKKYISVNKVILILSILSCILTIFINCFVIFGTNIIELIKDNPVIVLGIIPVLFFSIFVILKCAVNILKSLSIKNVEKTDVIKAKLISIQKKKMINDRPYWYYYIIVCTYNIKGKDYKFFSDPIWNDPKEFIESNRIKNFDINIYGNPKKYKYEFNEILNYDKEKGCPLFNFK